MYCFKFQKFKKLFIVFITVLTISLTIGIYTITSSAIEVSPGYIQSQFDYGDINIQGSVFSGNITSFQFTLGSNNNLSMVIRRSGGSSTYFLSDSIFENIYPIFVLSYVNHSDFTNSGDIVFSQVFDFTLNESYNMPDYDGEFDGFRFNFISKSFQLFTTRIVKNGSVIESGTAQLNKSIINPDSFTFSFFDSGLVGDSFRVSAVQTTPTTFNGSAFPPLNINIGEVAKVVLYDADDNELGFISGPFKENREYNIKEYFPDVATFEIVISTPILVEETTNGLFASLGWVGTVLSNLVTPSGRLFPLLQLFVISICVSLLLLAFYYIRKAIWGS